ncbi:hypothetical protein ACWD6Q_33190 [Streptomyces nigra]
MTAALVDWPSLAADRFPYPAHLPASRLVDELAVALVSRDPGVRDDGAYAAAAHWIREGRLDAVLEGLGDSAAGRFSHREVQARTFAPLILSAVLTRAAAVPGRVSQERRVTASQTEYRYVQLEDARLARALVRVLQGPGLTSGEATGWLDVVAEALDGGGPGPVPVWAFNTFATLQSLHLHLTRGIADEGLPPHAEAVATRVAELLRLPYYWLA